MDILMPDLGGVSAIRQIRAGEFSRPRHRPDHVP